MDVNFRTLPGFLVEAGIASEEQGQRLADLLLEEYRRGVEAEWGEGAVGVADPRLASAERGD